MAEKLRRARSAGFHDFEEPEAVGAAPVERAAEPVERSEPRGETISPPGEGDAGGGSGSLQASMRLDSIERRLFDLRAALDELAAGQPDTVPDAAGSHTPTDAEAWIAFAAAAVRRSDDAGAQAEIADQLLAEFRKRRARGGVLGSRE
jgi:hypothetical protein